MSHSGWSTSNYISAVGGTFPTAVPLTMHVRYKPSAFTGVAYLFSISDGSTSNEFSLRVNTAQTVGLIASISGGNVATSTGTVSAGTWYSLTGVCATATDRRLYIDGVQDGSTTVSKVPVVNNLKIGIRGSSLSPALGSLAEVALWNVELSADEVASLVFKSPKTVRPAALVTYLKLLDNGNRDEVALPATVTGTLTKDTDHPRVYYQRRNSGLWTPNFTAGGGGDAEAVGSSAGTSTAAATGQSTARASSTVTGTSTVAATGQSTAASAGSAAGTGAAAATGAFTGEVQAVGTAAGTSAASAVGTSTGGTTTDTHDGIGYGDPFRRKRRPKKGKREKAVEDLLKKLMGLVPDDPPPAIEAEAEIAQASVERLFAPTVDVTPNLEALQFAQLQLAKLEAMLNRYLEEEEDTDDLLLMAA